MLKWGRNHKFKRSQVYDVNDWTDTSTDAGTGGLGWGPNPSLGPVRGRVISPGWREAGEFVAWVGVVGNLYALRAVCLPSTDTSGGAHCLGVWRWSTACWRIMRWLRDLWAECPQNRNPHRWTQTHPLSHWERMVSQTIYVNSFCLANEFTCTTERRYISKLNQL